MSSTPRRIGVVMLLLAVGGALVLLQLFWLMLGQNELWTLRSYLNRWTFRDVPTHRGAILDRHGRVLAADAPSFELLVDYQAFRRYHAVGAAVHGATLLAAAAGSGRRFSYLDADAGPAAACAVLLRLPLAWLQGGAASAADRRDVRFYVVSLLAQCAHRSRGSVYRELRAAEQRGDDRCVGDALHGLDAAGLQAAFARVLDQLLAVDLALQRGEGRGELLATLDDYRQECYVEADGESRPDPSRLRPLADRVAFDLAAGLRTQRSDHPGLWLEPAVVREASELLQRQRLLPSLVGAVKLIDRLADDRDELRQRVQQRRQQIIGERELVDVVPDELVGDDIADAFRRRAQQHVEAMVRIRDRHGSSGIEAAMDAVLAGDPGLRLVEHDKQAREQKQWSRLEVRPGEDVQLSFDLDLQQLADRVTSATAGEWQPRVAAGEGAELALRRFGVGLCVLDAWTGEVLALSGEPHDAPELHSRPLGLNWRGLGTLGSVVKPFVALEQLQAEAQGRPCTPLALFHDCHGRYRDVGGQLLTCLHADHEAGRDLVLALMKSCNAFFFQVAEGLGEDGLERALRRFGLLAGVGEFPAGTYAPRPFGVSSGMVSLPVVDRHVLVQKRAIGYGLDASPVLVARAYAALATGVLRPATLVRGQDLPAVPLDLTEPQLELVREGLRRCVDDPHGTAYEQAALRRFGVRGKTGTAEVSRRGDNNAWFAGYLPYRAADGVQLAFAAVVYYVPDRSYGGDVAGAMLGSLLEGIAADPVLAARYPLQEGQ